MRELATETIPAPADAQAPRVLPAGLATRWPWIAFALALLFLPLALRSGTALSVMSLSGIAVIFALSYNMLLGQAGMLSFGHAVYYGFGAYFAVHAINAAAAAGLPLPLPLVPLVGGLGGLASAMLLGWFSTRRGGTVFAMISLGLAELVGSSSLILRSFFGGEEGVSTNRTRLLPVLGWTFGPQIQVYYLIAAWCLLCTLLMYGLTRTPFGRMCNAVRDNPERVQFVGYSSHVVRYIAFCLSGLFAGVAGGLVAINFELANSALFGAAQSGNVILATFIGGAGHFAGPIAGAVLITYLQTMLSDVTEVWQLYLGLLFIAAVMYAPGGLAGLVLRRWPVRRPAAPAPGAATPSAAPAVAAAPAPEAPALELRGLRKSFGPTAVIRGVDLSIPRGERHAVIGPNGAGKSTLFNLVSGLVAPSAGGVWLDGRPVGGLPPYEINRRGLSRSFQVTNTFDKMSVWENVRCALLWATGERYAFWKAADWNDEVAARAHRVLADVDLLSRRDVPAGALTYTEQRALEIGITLAAGAGVVLLDEPTAGMSHEETTRAVELIRRLSEGRTLVIVEHDMSVVFGLADRISVLVYGEIVASGTPAEIRADARVREAYLGEEAR